MAANNGNDSELLTLIHRWMEGEARLVELYPIQDAAEDRYMKSLPDRPVALYVQKIDWTLHMPYGRGDTFETVRDGKRAFAYTQQAVEELRSMPRTRADFTKLTGDKKTGWTPGRKPDPKAQARADEIVAAWDEYTAALREARERSGYAEAREAVFDLAGELKELEERIAGIPATTPQGLLFKAKMVAFDPAFDGLDEQIENALQARESTGHFMGLSLVRDILHMNEGSS
jgi:hypothetical protein